MSGRPGQGTERDKMIRKAAGMRAAGKSIKDISKAIDRCRDTTENLLKTDEAKAIIARCHSRIIEKVPKAVENILVAVEDFQDSYSERNKVRANIAWEATKMVTQIPGISPTPSTSVVHNTFINNQTNVIDPLIMSLIERHLGSIDAVYEERKEDEQMVLPG